GRLAEPFKELRFRAVPGRAQAGYLRVPRAGELLQRRRKQLLDVAIDICAHPISVPFPILVLSSAAPRRCRRTQTPRARLSPVLLTDLDKHHLSVEVGGVIVTEDIIVRRRRIDDRERPAKGLQDI